MNCCMCKKSIGEGQYHTDYSFYGNFRIICGDCQNALNDLLSARKMKSTAAKDYINNLLVTNQYDPDINYELKHAMGMQLTPDEKTAANDYIKGQKKEKKEVTKATHQQQREKDRSQLAEIGFAIASIIFLIIAIYCYIVSIRPLDKDTAELLGITAIANVQATVFCAASFVSSVICCACMNLIKYLKK